MLWMPIARVRGSAIQAGARERTCTISAPTLNKIVTITKRHLEE